MGKNRYARICVSEVVDADGRLALPQGAASSPLIAYGLLEQALPVKYLEHSFPYADDLLITGNSKEDVAAKVSLYEANLVRHPAGPLHLGRVEYGEIADEGCFEFLGLVFSVQSRERSGLRSVRVEVPMEKRFEFRERLQKAVEEDVIDGATSRTCEYLVGFLSAAPTDDHERLVELACEIAQAAGLQTSPLVAAATRFLSRGDHLYPVDLRHVIDKRAMGGVSCSVVSPGDKFHQPRGNNAIGTVGVVLGLTSPQSLFDVSATDCGSFVDAGGTRAPRPSPITLAEVEDYLPQESLCGSRLR
ncbi:hypothetical protein EVC45_20200 [Paraburkholderia sp. UYCP14C]|uniref:hypothetical protein n=1 Tax=Paraburkholderia sp. UYCP14C TaxID=2511130 RepID=UPI00101F3208|nr:hypothetical protein [Paraburkholderia sp. UYCP14C]RZF28073.1 hypothetical protein EVC45_20200 [Paraburkholderia sp. UYCP14C]